MDFAVSANALGASRLFHSAIVTTFYFLSGVKSCFLFYFLNDWKSALGVFRFFAPQPMHDTSVQHAWYLGSSRMIPTAVGSAGVQQLPPLLKLRWHPSYERTSIPYHFSFIPKPYSLSGNFWWHLHPALTTTFLVVTNGVLWFCLQPWRIASFRDMHHRPWCFGLVSPG